MTAMFASLSVQNEGGSDDSICNKFLVDGWRVERDSSALDGANTPMNLNQQEGRERNESKIDRRDSKAIFCLASSFVCIRLYEACRLLNFRAGARADARAARVRKRVNDRGRRRRDVCHFFIRFPVGVTRAKCCNNNIHGIVVWLLGTAGCADRKTTSGARGRMSRL